MPEIPFGKRIHIFSVLTSAIATGATRKDACKSAMISQSTLYSWLKKGYGYVDSDGAEVPSDPEFETFAREFEAAEVNFKRGLLKVMVDASESGEKSAWKPAAWLLERRFKAEFSRINEERVVKMYLDTLAGIEDKIATVILAHVHDPEIQLEVAEEIQQIFAAVRA